jgi:hypothetical protein
MSLRYSRQVVEILISKAKYVRENHTPSSWGDDENDLFCIALANLIPQLELFGEITRENENKYDELVEKLVFNTWKLYEWSIRR